MTMRILMAALLVAGLSLAGCNAPEGQPQLPGPFTDPPERPEERYPDVNDPDDGEDGDEGNDTVGNGTTAPQAGNDTEPPPRFEALILVEEGEFETPASVEITIDAVNEDGVYFTYHVDFSGDGEDLTGDSRTFPVTFERSYPSPGTFNVSVTLKKWKQDAYLETGNRTQIVVEPGPTWDELCPTDPDAIRNGRRYVTPDGAVFEEHNNVAGLQRPDKNPDCPRPDIMTEEPPEPPTP